MNNMGVHNSIYLETFLADPLQVTFAKLDSWFQVPPILTSIHQLQELVKRPSHQIEQLVSKIGHDKGNML
jgi:HD-like signal output (HDOD) protein